VSQDPLHLLCVEPLFPGRLGAVADWLVRRRGYRCRFLCAGAESLELWPASVGQGLEVMVCPLGQAELGGSAVEWTRYLERGLNHAMAYVEALGLNPPLPPGVRLPPFDVALGRSAGLGSTLFVPVHQTGLPLMNLFDYFYHAHQHDLAEEMPSQLPVAYWHWRRSANAMDLLDLENGVLPWTPTCWQRDLYPPEYRDDFLVLHDGIDAERFRPKTVQGVPGSRTIAGQKLTPQAKVVTFVARSLDRVRGFDRFLALANRLLRARSDVLCVVLGSPVVQRGLDVQFFNQDYRSQLLAQSPLHDPGRVWFFDQAKPDLVAEVLAASNLHVYPGRAYPVSRSLLEAMAAGCVVLAADTEPVREVLGHGQTGLLLNPMDGDAFERQALAVLDDPAAHRPLGEAAAERARQCYSRDVNLPLLAERLTQRANRRA
jgi:glycosyltransferase involved in cell wall biosynthesis